MSKLLIHFTRSRSSSSLSINLGNSPWLQNLTHCVEVGARLVLGNLKAPFVFGDPRSMVKVTESIRSNINFSLCILYYWSRATKILQGIHQTFGHLRNIKWPWHWPWPWKLVGYEGIFVYKNILEKHGWDMWPICDISQVWYVAHRRG